MSEKTFGVYLAKEDPESDAYAKLDLPAQPWELLDALDKLHLQEGDRLTQAMATQQQLYQPRKKYQHKNRDGAGSHQHDG